MATQTANKGLNLLSSLTDGGVWGPLNNANWSTIDTLLGGAVTIPSSNTGGALTLTSSNSNNYYLNFAGVSTTSVVVTFPNVGAVYSIFNGVSPSSLYTLTLKTTAAGGQVIALPPNQSTTVIVSCGSFQFTGLHPVGAIVDFATTSIPNWISGCTVPPYLYCNGGAFSSATYPYLTTIRGGAVTPDYRGFIRSAYNDGTNRVTTAGGGVNGDAPGAAGGSQTVTLASSHMPPISYTDGGHTHVVTGQGGGAHLAALTGINAFGFFPPTGAFTNVVGTNITIGNASPAAFSQIKPIVISGIPMIRAG